MAFVDTPTQHSWVYLICVHIKAFPSSCSEHRESIAFKAFKIAWESNAGQGTNDEFTFIITGTVFSSWE